MAYGDPVPKSKKDTTIYDTMREARSTTRLWRMNFLTAVTMLLRPTLLWLMNFLTAVAAY